MQTNHQISISFDSIKEVQHLDNIMAKLTPQENSIRTLLGRIFRKNKSEFTPDEKHFMRKFRVKLKEFKI